MWRGGGRCGSGRGSCQAPGPRSWCRAAARGGLGCSPALSGPRDTPAGKHVSTLLISLAARTIILINNKMDKVMGIWMNLGSGKLAIKMLS